MGAARNGRGVAVAVVTVGLVHTAFPSIAHAGFFDFLFGPFQSRPVRPYEAYPGHMLAPWGADPGFRRHAGRGFRRHEHKLTARRKLNVADETDHPVGPLAPTDIMDDESLRRGDAVMTPTGIRIFIGSSGDHHEPEDFRKPSEIKGLPKRERKAFAALDAQGSGTDGKPVMATGRSASELTLVFGETIVDPQGRSIRYVGP
ncbi:MAG: hypothetical protein ACREDM_01140 [Methylocella sp.]